MARGACGRHLSPATLAVVAAAAAFVLFVLPPHARTVVLSPLYPAAAENRELRAALYDARAELNRCGCRPAFELEAAFRAERDILRQQVLDAQTAVSAVRDELALAHSERAAAERTLREATVAPPVVRACPECPTAPEVPACTGAAGVAVNVKAVYKPKRMREVIDWEAFDRKYVYSWRRYWSITNHQGNSRLELQEAITASKKYFDASNYAWQHGQVQADTRRGITYVMDFERQGLQPGSAKRFKRLYMQRPLLPELSRVEPDRSDMAEAAQGHRLHLVMPVSGRSDALAAFLAHFAAVALKPSHPPLHLTVVYQAERSEAAVADLERVRAMLADTGREHGLAYRVVAREEPFSRGAALMAGVHAIPESEKTEGDAMLLFVDVDMRLSEEFLWRCKATMAKGREAYFPIPFSMYRSSKNATSISQDTGAWRTYGLGMVCIFASDFLAHDGYSAGISGWGREDVDFYERVLKRAQITAVRATDEGLIHTWHPKRCVAADLTGDQYQDCLRSAADWEGPKVALASELLRLRAVPGAVCTDKRQGREMEWWRENVRRNRAEDGQDWYHGLPGSWWHGLEPDEALAELGNACA